MRKNLLKFSLGIGALTLAFGANAQCEGSDTLFFTGSVDSYTVPTNVTSLTIEVRGAQGGTGSSSTNTGGLGAIMIGDFTVTSGQVLNVLVGEQPASSNGGGGGTFVTDISNNPMIVAGGGGGSSNNVDDPAKHGNTTTSGGDAPDGGLGGTAGNGGGIGASFASGAGGGLLTNGADGWTSNTGGKSFLNGGTVTTNGGFGGGGSGSGYIVGGGGGGYSGGGGGSNSVAAGVGGGGGSFNAGTNQNNTGGVNSGNGMAIFTWSLMPDTSTSLVSQTITSNEAGATYRWLDCDNSFSVIAGETSQSFTATVNGNYAVEVTANGCTDTSACVNISTVGVSEGSFGAAFNVYPNPTEDIININLGAVNGNVNVSILTLEGKELYQQNLNGNTISIDLSDYSKGVYILKISDDKNQHIRRVFKH